MATLKAISLFTGAGGLDYGFEAAGFETAVAVEMEPAFCATLAANRNWPIINADINSVTTAQILKKGGLKPGEADVLIGGPPCQPFSKSGYWASGDSGRLLDPRASTLGAYMRVLKEARPRTFLLENVEGLGFKGKDEGLQAVMAALEDLNLQHGHNYRAAVRVVNAADYGVPQLRRRLLIVGSRDGREFQFPEPTHGPGKAPYVTAWDALHDLPDTNDPTLQVKGKWADLLPSIPEGITTSGTQREAEGCHCLAGGGDSGVSSSSSPRTGLPGLFKRSLVRRLARFTGTTAG